ncbi:MULTISPECIES: GTPase domain-containing protein [Nannocystis]|uniref:GTPase domain-containing protein n=1 Tax=Nannocystis radixulma TaxID=2995305 RepID=A0ABT5B6K2_9BACT|nr:MULTISPECIES: GTPase domain-containing protein [Nannocystis]MCY1060226.1 GTPase domain-containing protein [Nannocystis sp. SCPEA4]MDC0669295.1 GTPase domain-containing protein [Nannocystis radixulma]
MSIINTKAGEIGVKVVYFGPALAGKSTNIRTIHRKTRPELRGRLDEIAGDLEPMLSFDFAPDTLPLLDGRYRVRLHLVTVPGLVLSPVSRKLVLRGVDAVVFVADTQEEGGELVRFEENVESMQLLLSLLDDVGADSAVMPMVLQYNKRDLVEGVAAPPPESMHSRPIILSTLDALNEAINPNDLPTIEAVATEGIGVMDTLRTVVRDLLEPLRAEYEGSGDRYPIAGASDSWPRG